MTFSGIGIDITPLSRMEEARTELAFMERTFTPHERAYCEQYADASAHYAGTFAAKEAVRKATGELSRSFKEVEVRRTTDGKPEIWNGTVRRDDILLSITHDAGSAIAVALVIPPHLP